ncbi:hypothetical protein GCM10010266_72180 [Streptomyces griseomycini]|nr:hypothetical protein GCM10010266_72180 [Streptomyces griseomycini]
MENAIAACMKKQGFTYTPVAPEDPAASWTTYGADYALTKKYRQKYGSGIYAGIVYPDDAGASGSAADRQDSDRTPNADYVDTLTPEQKAAYSEALGAFPDPKAGGKNWTGCQGEADKEVYGSASAQERSIEAANRDQANAQAFNGDPELVALVQSYASCLRKEGISATTTQPTGVGETVRFQALRSAPAGGKGHPDEVFIEINGERKHLWRAVDRDGMVPDILVRSRRDTAAAERFLRTLLTKTGRVPRVIVTDKLRSHRAAHREVMPSVEHRSHKGLNNRAENSHRPTRQRERAMKGFRGVGAAQRFLAAFSGVSPHFRPRRHLMTGTRHRAGVTVRFAVREQVTAVTSRPAAA